MQLVFLLIVCGRFFSSHFSWCFFSSFDWLDLGSDSPTFSLKNMFCVKALCGAAHLSYTLCNSTLQGVLFVGAVMLSLRGGEGSPDVSSWA